MHKHARIFILPLTIALLIALATPACAANWVNQYNPNYDLRITPDAIQHLLEKYNSDLAHTKVVDGSVMIISNGRALHLGVDNYYGGVLSAPNFRDTALKTAVNARKLTPAEIIYYSAKQYDINVAYLLAILQKESSVIGRPGIAQSRLNFAAGFRPGRKPGQKNCGFFGQIMSCARRISVLGREQGRSMRAVFRIYTPPSASISAYNSFIDNMYRPYADALIDK